MSHNHRISRDRFFVALAADGAPTHHREGTLLVADWGSLLLKEDGVEDPGAWPELFPWQEIDIWFGGAWRSGWLGLERELQGVCPTFNYKGQDHAIRITPERRVRVADPPAAP